MDVATVTATTSVLSAIATLAVVGRFWARKLKKQQHGNDDWTSLASLVIMWALAGVTLKGTSMGIYGSRELDVSKPNEDLEMKDVEQLISKYNFVKCILLIAGLGLVKLSVVFLYRRIFKVVKPFHLYSIGLIILLSAWAIGFLLANLFQCGTRLWALWKSNAAMLRYCKASAPASYGFVVSDIVTDVLVLVSPIPIVWHMKVSTSRKFGITGLFALGTLSTAAACGRMYTFLEARQRAKSPWQMESELAIWALIELSVAVLAACLPVMRPLFQSGNWVGSAFMTRPSLSHHAGQKGNEQWVEINNV
ncbi:hypothetical protein BU23DRAFT_598633 [Bimuria novae-zelandiae CBS 107.79]|uniref:Rhodopsin domain-containing protein n=1 Tax=Bimuria novae-zelandiae CBS 107.79 TaxID=1447943 RepID=A0A6A5VKX9_9PLEO|nr:hypothetical protein BU23DRAFT_598633 [Bimuria novae-zelandiae CBS 107.79]